MPLHRQAVSVGCKAKHPNYSAFYLTMKLRINRTVYLILSLPLLTLLACSDNNTKARPITDKRNINIKSFTVSILNSYYAEAYSIETILTDKQLKIIFKSDLVGEKDTVVFIKSLLASDTLQQISEIDINQLKDYYSNPCIDDGSQVTVIIEKDNKTKSIHVSNYYQDDIGKIIYLVNSLVPEKYKVWYNKETLIADYKECEGIK